MVRHIQQHIEISNIPKRDIYSVRCALLTKYIEFLINLRGRSSPCIGGLCCSVHGTGWKGSLLGALGSGVTLPFGAPLLTFCRPHKFFSHQKKKKKKKKVATFFSVFLIGFLPPGPFCTPKYFFRVGRTLSWPRYGTFCYFVKRFFV